MLNRYQKSLLLLSALSISACGGSSSSSSSSMSVSATVGSDYTVAYTPTLMDKVFATIVGNTAMALGSRTTVDQVVAIPSSEGHFGGSMLQLMKVADIANDGRFSLTLDKSYDWVILLIDSTALTLSDRVVSYVTASVNSSDTLVAYSGGSIQSSLDLGTLAQANDEAVGQADTASFNLTLDAITAVAQSDNGYKHMINAYLNYDQTTGVFYAMQPTFNWQAVSLSGLGNIDPVVNDISGYALAGFSLKIETNNLASPTIPDEACSGNSTITLFPPATIQTSTGRTYDAVNGVSNDGGGSDTNMGIANSANWFQSGRYYCYDDDFGVQYYQTSETALYDFGRDFQVPAGGMPTGHWLLDVGGATKGEFDLEVSVPKDAAGNYNVPIPMLRINHDATSGVISLIDVSWFIYDSVAAQYVEMTAEQIAAIGDMTKESFISVQDEDGPDPATNAYTANIIGPVYDTGLLTSADLSNISTPAYFPGSAGDVTGNIVPTYISITYSIGGLEYSFVWNN